MQTIESILYRSYLLRQINSLIDMASPRDKLHPPESGKESSGLSNNESRSSSTAPATPCSKRRRRITRPEPGSLYDILREHSGTALYLLPICWNDLHVRLLNVNFIQLDPILLPVPSPTPGYMRDPSRLAAALGRELNTLVSPFNERPFSKTRALKDVLATFFPDTMSRPKSSVELNIYFGGRVFRKAVRVPIMWKGPGNDNTSFDSADTRQASSFGRISSGTADNSGNSQATTTQPILGYVNRAQLATIRRTLFRVVPGPENGDRKNTPVSRLQRLRSKALVPANVDEDAHFVGMILAMAQSVFYSEPSSRSSSQSSSRSGISLTDEEAHPAFRDIKVRLLTISEDTAEFIVYTAVVTATFLQRFASPAKAPPPTAGSPANGPQTVPSSRNGGLDITYTKVPVWPILGLKERLGKALGHEIAGDVPLFDETNPDNVEMWETPEERQRRLNTLKRRRATEREALAEVINSSFEAEDEADASEVLGVIGGSQIESDDSPVFSPSAKRRCTRTIHSLEVC